MRSWTQRRSCRCWHASEQVLITTIWRKQKKHGIICTNCPGVNSVSVAEYTVMLMLNLFRECPQLNEDTKKGGWRRLMVTELHGKNVGLLGFGAVARQTAMILRDFSCQVCAYDPFPNEEAAQELGVELCSREEVLEKSDILSIYVPALPETYHFLDAKALVHCRDGVYVVNTSRGTNADE